MHEALDRARNALARGDINTAVSCLQEDLGGDKHALRETVLLLLDQPSLSSEFRQGLLEQVFARQPDFNFDVYGKEGRKPLDLALDVAVRHDDRDLAC